MAISHQSLVFNKKRIFLNENLLKLTATQAACGLARQC